MRTRRRSERRARLLQPDSLFDPRREPMTGPPPVFLPVLGNGFASSSEGPKSMGPPPLPREPTYREQQRSIDERFAAFHAKHPEVLEQLVAMCRQARSRGRRHLGIGMLWEAMRWNRLLEGLPDPAETHYLNDHYRSRYARLLMAEYPELDGIFETRQLRSP